MTEKVGKERKTEEKKEAGLNGVEGRVVYDIHVGERERERERERRGERKRTTRKAH